MHESMSAPQSVRVARSKLSKPLSTKSVLMGAYLSSEMPTQSPVEVARVRGEHYRCRRTQKGRQEAPRDPLSRLLPGRHNAHAHAWLCDGTLSPPAGGRFERHHRRFC
jgi:hypothetical protein